MGLVGQPLTAVWMFDESKTEYNGNTVEAALAGGTAFTLLGNIQDYTYFGFSRRFDALAFVMGTSLKGGTLTWEYGAGLESWIRFIPVYDDAFAIINGYMLWDIHGSTIESDWISFAFTNLLPHAVPCTPDSGTLNTGTNVARFWIRVSSQASVTGAGTVKSVVCRPYVTYATALDVSNQLQLRNTFSTTSIPSISTVEDYIRGAEDMMVQTMGEAWRLEFIEEELLNFKQYGMKTRYQPIVNMYDLAVYSGSKFDTKTVGRGQDYHFEARTGMLYLSTIFLDAMPPTFRRSYTARREYGAFKRPVQIRYSHGHDIRSHQLGQQVKRIATKQAAIDVVSNQDFSPLIPLGLDTVSLQAKIDNWAGDIKEFLDQFSKIKVF